MLRRSSQVIRKLSKKSSSIPCNHLAAVQSLQFSSSSSSSKAITVKSLSHNGAIFRLSTRSFSSLPHHKVVGLPSLSPTMEHGSISKWNVTEGAKFEPGTSFCDVETDKAIVSFDATDEGYVAKILVGSGEVKVGQPIMVTVEEQADVAAFANFTLSASAAAPAAAAAPAKPAAAPATPQPVAPPTSAPAQPPQSAQKPSSTGDRIFASPLAKKLTREANQTIQNIHSALNGQGSGPNNRIIAADVAKGLSALASQPAQPVTAAPIPQASPAAQQAAAPVAPRQPQQVSPSGPYSDFELSDATREYANLLAYTKQTVPHYCVSVELNLKQLLQMREQFNKQLNAGKKKGDKESAGLSVLDFIVKAAALAMKQIPDVNSSWMDTFVRRYDQVDINLVMGSGSLLATPVIRNVGGKGLLSISDEIGSFEDSLFSSDKSVSEKFLADPNKQAVGTFSIHNLGVYGVKAAAPIVRPSQGCALALGVITDTVIPSQQEGKEWEIAPIMVATISCDHRVVDGAVSAQYMAAFKQLIENPMNLML